MLRRCQIYLIWKIKGRYLEERAELVGVFFALGGIGQFLVRHIGVKRVVCVARENVEVIVERVLIAGRLVILQRRNPLAVVRLSHRGRDLAGNGKNVST